MELESEKKRKTKRGKKEKEEEDDVVVVIEDDNDDEIEQRERRNEDVLGKREQQVGQNEGEGEGEGEGEREEEMMKRRRKEEEEKKKRFECGICLELMNWEKEPRLLPCCGLSFCSLCLHKLFLLQNPYSSSSSSSSSSPSSPSSSPSLKGVKCPVCREMNECESIETLSMNYLIPETIDVLLSSNLISLSQQSTSGFSILIFFSFFSFAAFELSPKTTPKPNSTHPPSTFTDLVSSFLNKKNRMCEFRNVWRTNSNVLS